MLPANVSPTCSSCGHVMQPVGDRTLVERPIGGGEPTAFWPGREYECVECRTRTVLAYSRPLVPGSVGYAEAVERAETLATIPAKRFISAEHLPPGVRRDSTRLGGTLPLSQRQQAARIVSDFWETDGANPVDALDRIAVALGVDVRACLQTRAESIARAAGIPDAAIYPNGACLALREPDGQIVGSPDTTSYEDEVV